MKNFLRVGIEPALSTGLTSFQQFFNYSTTGLYRNEIWAINRNMQEKNITMKRKMHRKYMKEKQKKCK